MACPQMTLVTLKGFSPLSKPPSLLLNSSPPVLNGQEQAGETQAGEKLKQN